MSGHGAELSSADELQTRAARLRRAVNASRARLDAQNLRAETLRRELAILRNRADGAAKEAVWDSARVAAAPLAAHRQRRTRAVLSLAALGLAALALSAVVPARRTANASSTAAENGLVAAPLPDLPLLASPRTDEFLPTDDDEAAQALLLAAGWRDPEDGLTLDERLGPPVDLPGVPPTWNAERTGARSYLVRRRGPGGEVDELTVDLGLGSVAPCAATRRRPTPALVTRR